MPLYRNMLNVKNFAQPTNEVNIKIQFWGPWRYDKKAEFFKKEILKKYPNAKIVLEKDETLTDNFKIENNGRKLYDKEWIGWVHGFEDLSNVKDFMKGLKGDVEPVI